MGQLCRSVRVRMGQLLVEIEEELEWEATKLHARYPRPCWDQAGSMLMEIARTSFRKFGELDEDCLFDWFSDLGARTC